MTTDRDRPCARYFGSDGTLCATHNGRFASPSTGRCDRASVPLAGAMTTDRDRLAALLWEAELAIHYAENHRNVMHGRPIATCTEGLCPRLVAAQRAPVTLAPDPLRLDPDDPEAVERLARTVKRNEWTLAYDPMTHDERGPELSVNVAFAIARAWKETA